MDYSYLRPFDSTSYAFNNTNTSTMQPTYAIPVTLTSVRNPADRRDLVIHAGERVTIGRASRSEAKDLRETSDNALFDCPVVSRQHAELRAHPFKAAEEQVTITDRESMHGTSVNGKRLAPYVPFSLTSGDCIKFGDRVTRGSDTHDGVIVTFDRSATTTKSYTEPSQVISRNRGFQVPSDSENDSDAASDNESVMSEHVTSSAKTTPEQTKAAPGTQEQPIDIEEADHTALRTIIDLDDDYTPPSAQSPKAEQPKVVQDTYAESDDAESVHEESENEDESDDEHVPDDLDNLSDSDASDLSNHYDDSGEVSEAEGPELLSSKKQASPELGTPEDAPKPAQNLHWRPYPKPAAPAYALYHSRPMEATAANDFASSRPPYDPVRGSNPPQHDPFWPRGSVRANAPYTYGNSDIFGGSLPAKAATDSYDSSRWDIPPRTSSLHPPPPPPPSWPPAPISQSYYTAPLPNYPVAPPNFAYNLNTQPPPPPASKHVYGYGSQPTSSVMGSTSGSLRSPSEAVPEPERETPSASVKPSKITIDDIVEGSSMEFRVVSDNPSTTDDNTEPTAVEKFINIPVGTKRKAAAISTDAAAEATTTNWAEILKVMYPEQTTVQQPAVKRARTMKSVGAEAAKLATAALVGGVGTIAFLASPFAQQLLDSL